MLAFLAFRYLCIGFSLVASVLLGTGVFLRPRKAVIHRIFVLLAFTLAFYQFSVFMTISARTATEAHLWAESSSFSIYAVSTLILFFSYTFLYNGVKRHWILKYYMPLTAISGITVVLLLRGLVVDVSMHGMCPKVEYSPNFGWIALMVSLNSLLSVANFLRVWRKESGLRSAQAPYLMGGILSFWVLGASIGFVLPLFGIIEVEGLGAAGAILMLLPIGYTIMRYRLFDVSVAARRLLTYAVTSAILASIYGLCLLIFSYSFSLSQEIPFRVTVFPLILASVVSSALLVPINRRVKDAMARLFLRDVYDSGALTRSLSQVFRSVSELESLLHEVLRKVCTEMGISDGRVFLQIKDTNRFVLAAREGVVGDDVATVVTDKSPFVRHLEPGGDIVIREEWQRYHFDEDALEVQRDMERLQAHVGIPLGLSRELIGFVALGHKFSGHIYTQQDIDFFRVFSAQLTIAIDNALLYSELQNDKLYQETILNNLSSGVITVNLEKKITAFNQTAENILGFSHEYALGKAVADISKTFDLLLVKTLSQRHAYQEEIYVQLQSERRLPLNMSLSPLLDATGSMIGGLIVFTDISELKQLQKAMRQNERLASLGTMAAGIAHEIKNPMVSIKTFAQLLPERYGDEEFRSTFYNLAAKEIDRINTLVEHMMNLARPADVQYEPISLVGVLQEVQGLLATEMQDRRIELRTDFKHSEMKSPADFRQMKQVFLNLLLNAKESIQSDGVIEIKTCRTETEQDSITAEPFQAQGQQYLVQVIDSGGGIPPEELGSIFDPFFTTKTTGNGLGLSITHKIITDHGGSITVDSQPGRTVFSVWLPIIFEEALV